MKLSNLRIPASRERHYALLCGIGAMMLAVAVFGFIFAVNQ